MKFIICFDFLLIIFDCFWINNSALESTKAIFVISWFFTRVYILYSISFAFLCWCIELYIAWIFIGWPMKTDCFSAHNRLFLAMAPAMPDSAHAGWGESSEINFFYQLRAIDWWFTATSLLISKWKAGACWINIQLIGTTLSSWILWLHTSYILSICGIMQNFIHVWAML